MVGSDRIDRPQPRPRTTGAGTGAAAANRGRSWLPAHAGRGHARPRKRDQSRPPGIDRAATPPTSACCATSTRRSRRSSPAAHHRHCRRQHRRHRPRTATVRLDATVGAPGSRRWRQRSGAVATPVPRLHWRLHRQLDVNRLTSAVRRLTAVDSIVFIRCNPTPPWSAGGW